MRPSLIRLAALVFGSLAPTPSPMLADEITAVAITLGSAPGLGGGRYETFPEMPIINDAGKVAFDATLSDATGGSDSGLFRSDAANNAVAIAREGEASGSPGVTLGSVGGQFAMNDQGRVFFPNFLSGAGVTAANNSGLFVGNTSGGFSLQVREGSFVSGRNVTSFGSLRAAGGRFVSTLRTSNAGQPQLEALLSLNSQGANPTIIALKNAFGPITSFGTTTVGDGGEIVMNGRTLGGSSSQLAALFRITSAGTQTLFLAAAVLQCLRVPLFRGAGHQRCRGLQWLGDVPRVEPSADKVGRVPRWRERRDTGRPGPRRRSLQHGRNGRHQPPR